VMYEGIPMHPAPDRLWQIVAKHKVRRRAQQALRHGKRGPWRRRAPHAFAQQSGMTTGSGRRSAAHVAPWLPVLRMRRW